jgi:glycosyltransferase involved in cell wall biosynthesis
MKKTIIFHDNNLTIRGTSVALYNYADYNEKILGNKSIIMTRPDDYVNAAKDKFTKRFECHFSWFHGYDTENFAKSVGADYFYVIKEGTQRDGIILQNTPTLVHSVFCNNDPHGHRYAYVSDWLAKNQGYNPETHSVPHMIEKLPPPPYDLRKKLGIPKNKIVFGCYGGSTEFNINWVHHIIKNVVTERDDIVFLFMNINKFNEEDHPNIIFLPGTWILEEKSAFINACDAMLHGRFYGETFGLSCGEFAMENKPIITYNGSGERNHIDILGERGIYYEGMEDLYDILNNFKKYIKFDDYDIPYKQYSPEIIMDKFNKVFLS